MHISGRVRISRVGHVRTSPGAPKRMPGERAAPTHQGFSDFARVCSRTFAFFAFQQECMRPARWKASPAGAREKTASVYLWA